MILMLFPQVRPHFRPPRSAGTRFRSRGMGMGRTQPALASACDHGHARTGLPHHRPLPPARRGRSSRPARRSGKTRRTTPRPRLPHHPDLPVHQQNSPPLARLFIPATNAADHDLAWPQFRHLHQTRALLSRYRSRGHTNHPSESTNVVPGTTETLTNLSISYRES